MKSIYGGTDRQKNVASCFFERTQSERKYIVKKILIALFLMLILVFSIVGIAANSSEPGTDIDQQRSAVSQTENHHLQ